MEEYREPHIILSTQVSRFIDTISISGYDSVTRQSYTSLCSAIGSKLSSMQKQIQSKSTELSEVTSTLERVRTELKQISHQ